MGKGKNLAEQDYMKGAYQEVYEHPRWKTEAKKYETHLASALLHDTYTVNAVKTMLTRTAPILQNLAYREEQDLNTAEKEKLKAAVSLKCLADKICPAEAADEPAQIQPVIQIPSAAQAQPMIQIPSAVQAQPVIQIPPEAQAQPVIQLPSPASAQSVLSLPMRQDADGYDRDALEADLGEREQRRREHRITSWIRRKKYALWESVISWSAQIKKRMRGGESVKVQTDGEASRLLGCYRLLGETDHEKLLNFRLALIAYLISFHSDSLEHILIESQSAGVKGTEDMSEKASMYMHIDPLDTETLREEFTETKEFPHEIVYKEMLNDLYRARKENKKKKLGEKKFQKEEAYRAQAEQELNEAYMILRLYNERAVKIGQWQKRQMQIQNNLQYLKYLQYLQYLQNQYDPVVQASLEGGLHELQKAEENIARLLEELAVLTTDDAVNRASQTVAKYDEQGADNFTLYQRRDLRVFGTDAGLLNAQDLALNIYTTAAYAAMNLGQREDDERALDRLKEKNSYYGWTEGEVKNKKLLRQIAQMIRITARIVQDTLEERGSRPTSDQEAGEKHGFDGWTYRGGFGMESWYDHGEYVAETLMSTSKDRMVALNFYQLEARKNLHQEVLTVFRLKNRSSVDVSDLSVYETEQEVLVAKGARFKVVKGLTKYVPLKNVSTSGGSYQADPDMTDAKMAAETQAIENAKDEAEAKERMEERHVNVVQLEQITDASMPLPARFRKKIKR